MQTVISERSEPLVILLLQTFRFSFLYHWKRKVRSYQASPENPSSPSILSTFLPYLTPSFFSLDNLDQSLHLMAQPLTYYLPDILNVSYFQLHQSFSHLLDFNFLCCLELPLILLLYLFKYRILIDPLRVS